MLIVRYTNFTLSHGSVVHSIISSRLCFVKLKLVMLAIQTKNPVEGVESEIAINPRDMIIKSHSVGFFLASSENESTRWIFVKKTQE